MPGGINSSTIYSVRTLAELMCKLESMIERVRDGNQGFVVGGQMAPTASYQEDNEGEMNFIPFEHT
jgi:hypothetical protein